MGPIFANPTKDLQTRMKVSTPGDIHEQKADRIADRVMRTSQSPHSCACGGGCPKCQEKHGEAADQIQTSGAANAARETRAPSVINDVVNSSGRQLDSNTRLFMESRFGHDFSEVRVHTDSEAATSAAALNARAFTKGQHVVFGSGEYAPGTTEGDRIMAHELAHVVQQERGSEVVQRYPKGPGKLTPYVENQVDKALATMKTSELGYEVSAAEAILDGTFDIAFPDFEDTSVTPYRPMSPDEAMTRLLNWRVAQRDWQAGPKAGELNIRALVPGTQDEINFPPRGGDAVTLQHSRFNRVIYLFAAQPARRLDEILLHEVIHLRNPLQISPGEARSDREVFVGEIRAYYYGSYRNVDDPQRRFEKSITSAEGDTRYLASQGMSLEREVFAREMWMAEVGAP